MKSQSCENGQRFGKCRIAVFLISWLTLLESSFSFISWSKNGLRAVNASPPWEIMHGSSFLTIVMESKEVTETGGFLLLPTSLSQLDRFHSDMVRALESRQRLADQHYSSGSIQRHHRPSILSQDVDGAERAQKMLQHMIDIDLATQQSFSIVMKAFLQRGRTRWPQQTNTDGNDTALIICAADQLEFMLEQLEKRAADIDTATYNLVLEAYATCATPRGERNYAKRADSLFQRMESLGKFNAKSLSHVVHAWSWQQGNMQPRDGAQRAYELVERIQEMTEDNDNSLVLQCYDWVLEAFSKSAGGVQQAALVFQTMKELSRVVPNATLPDAQSYSNVILAWSKCSEGGSAEMGHELLHEMVNRYKVCALPQNCEPELIAFNAVSTAWARIGRPDRAENILWLMDDVRGVCKNLVPDAMIYNSVLHAHVKSRDKVKALCKAIVLVRHMEDHCQEQPAIRPNAFSYNTLMKVNFEGCQRINHMGCTRSKLASPPSLPRLGYKAVVWTQQNKQKKYS